MVSSMRSGTPLWDRAQEIVYNITNYLVNQESQNLKNSVAKAKYDAIGV